MNSFNLIYLDYGDVKVQGFSINFGPFCGIDVWLLMTGKPKADDLSIELKNRSDQSIGNIAVQQCPGHYKFRMPSLNQTLTGPSCSVWILVKHQQEEIHREEFRYVPIDR